MKIYLTRTRKYRLNMNSTMKTNILDVGCGLRKDGTINIDSDVSVRPDILCDMLHLPFRENSFDKIILRWVVEHTLNPDLLITESHKVLIPKGVMEISFPNFASFRFV